jgi:hypothetical protein
MKETTLTVRSETGDKFRRLRNEMEAFGTDQFVRKLMLVYERSDRSARLPAGAKL